ncbi:hypothetical protein [Stenotrophomonas hibiscicola]
MGIAKAMAFDRPWSGVSNLPPEAHCEPEGAPFEPAKFWLERAAPADQQTAVAAWWYSRYCDPAYETPYDGREGGYFFVHGGPFDPSDILWDKFGGVAADKVIEAVIGQLHTEVGDAWAPLRWGNPYEYDEDYDVIQPSERSAPRDRLTKALLEGQKLQTLSGDAATKALLNRLAFSHLFSAFETYLWETMVYWLEADLDSSGRILDRLPEFANKDLKGKEARAFIEKGKENIKGYMQRLPWHRWSDVRPLLQIGLDVPVPEFKSFSADVRIRHDIVHRNGMTNEGDQVDVTEQMLSEFGARINAYAEQLEGALEKKEGDF